MNSASPAKKPDWPCLSCGYTVFGSKDVCPKCRFARKSVVVGDRMPANPAPDLDDRVRALETRLQRLEQDFNSHRDHHPQPKGLWDNDEPSGGY